MEFQRVNTDFQPIHELATTSEQPQKQVQPMPDQTMPDAAKKMRPRLLF
jgi:hypothetical protein